MNFHPPPASSQPSQPQPEPEPTPFDDLSDTEKVMYDKVLRWRCMTLLDLGMNPDQARALALDRFVDLHDVRRLVKLGCPISTVFDIVAS